MTATSIGLKVSLLATLIISLRLFSPVVKLSFIEQVLTLAIFVIFLCVIIRSKDFKFKLVYFSVLSCLFFLSLFNGMLTTLVFDLSFVEPLRSVIRYFALLVIIILPIYVKINFNEVNRYYCWFILLPGAIFVLISVMIGGYAEYQGQLRLAFPYSNPNSLALFCLNSIFILSCNLFTRSRNSSLFLIPIVIFSYGLVKSGGLTALSSLLVFALFVYLLSFPLWRKLALVPIVATVSALAFYFSYDLIYQRLDGVVFTDFSSMELSQGSSVLWRLRAWSVYIDTMTLIDYIFGHGLGVSRFLLVETSPVSNVYNFSAPGTHSDYVQLFIDFGLIGVVLFFALVKNLISLLSRLSRVDTRSNVFIAFVFCILTYMLMDNVLDTAFFFYVAFYFSCYIASKSTLHSHSNLNPHSPL
ncbi:O-antigen ligase family protein [Vibrio vulnificus]|nr:O-antigen ligase family protein [Vibrio vulnificus]